MIPLLPLLWRYRKLAGYALAAAAVGLLAWRVTVWRAGYLERGEAVAELETERLGRSADRQQYADQLQASQAAREALAADMQAIRDRFRAFAVPRPETLTVPVEVPIAAGQTTCPSPRLSPEFVRLWTVQAAP